MKQESPFPVYDRLVLSGALSLDQAPKMVDARQAFDMVTKNAVEKEVNAADFGPVVPPYKSLWLEGEDRSVLPGSVVRFAVHVEADVDAYSVEGRGARVRHQMTAYTMAPSGMTQSVPVAATFTVDEQGRLDQFERAVRADDLAWFRSCDDADKENVTTIARRCAVSALFALSLMHCRNVKQEPARHQPKPRRKGGHQRPAVEYHVINLPGAQRATQASTEATGTAKLHTARGHFKTYTAEAPLMGKHVGTYYWGWQVRGSKKNGEIISTYKVGATA